MTSEFKSNEFLVAVVTSELAKLTMADQLEVARILSEYIHLLDEGKIEAASNLIQSNYSSLVKII